MNAPPDVSVFRRHGGRLAAAQALFPTAPRPWLDVSTGINPIPYPGPDVTRRSLTRLPEPEALAALEASAAAAFGVGADRVAATPGTEAALRLLPRLLGARSVAIAAPTYGGHFDAWRAVGTAVVAWGAAAEARVVVNPNNPDGRIMPATDLLAAAQTGWMIVDEAFADPHPEASVAAHAGGRLIVLRSFGKFYGLPGLRLGFVLAGRSLAAQIRRAFGEWPVSNGAILIGQAAYADTAWRERTRRRLRRDPRAWTSCLRASVSPCRAEPTCSGWRTRRTPTASFYTWPGWACSAVLSSGTICSASDRPAGGPAGIAWPQPWRKGRASATGISITATARRSPPSRPDTGSTCEWRTCCKRPPRRHGRPLRRLAWKRSSATPAACIGGCLIR